MTNDNLGQRHAPEVILKDAASNEQKPHMDVYTAGFPCQPYSFLTIVSQMFVNDNLDCAIE